MSKKLKENIDPQIAQIVLLDELCERLEDLQESITKLDAFNKYMGPMLRMFPRDRQYQYATVPAGGSAQVYYLDNPQSDLIVGIITQVANDWYPNTRLEWYVDYTPKQVEYSIASITAPKHYERGIPFGREVKWIAYNNDVVSHVFGVLCDGYFIDREIYDKIVSEPRF